MSRPTFASLLSFLVVLFVTRATAAETPAEHHAFTPQAGLVTIGANLATIDVPDKMNFYSPDDARYLLEKMWHNPPNISVIGMVVTKPENEQTEPAVIVVSYAEDGHVADDDAKSINYDSLLKDMQEGAHESNEARVQEGYSSIDLLGWAEPPHYDAATKKLFWAKNLRFGNETETTLNYCIRILGRKGVLELNAIGKTTDLKTIGPIAQSVMLKTVFTSGNRYEDFQEGTDLKAAGGIAALIVGGLVAKKLGILALVGFGFLKFFKLLILPLIFLGGWIASWFKKRGDQKKDAEQKELEELDRRRNEDTKKPENPNVGM